MEGWVKVYATGQFTQASMVRNLLESKDIPALSLNKQDSSYLFGEHEIYVKQEDAVRAKHILSSTLNE